MAPYDCPFSTAEPGCIIILIDQSANTGAKEAPAISLQVNRILSELILQNWKKDRIIPRVLVGMYGYSGAGVNWAAPGLSPNSEGLVSISDVSENVEREYFDEEYEQFLPLVVPEQAFGDAPIVPALEKAREIAESFAQSHPNSFPPVVINITAGDFGHLVERDFLSACFDITKVGTSDGASLMIHGKVNSQSKTTAFLPTSPEGLDASSNLLFRASSMMPNQAIRLLQSRWTCDLGTYPRFFAENTDFTVFHRSLIFHSSAAEIFEEEK